MDFIFELIIEILTIPLERWDKLKVRYKIIILAVIFTWIAWVVILFN